MSPTIPAAANCRATAHFDTTATAVVIRDLTIADLDVVREAQRWITGSRGPVIDDPVLLSEANLADFAVESIRLGAHALSVTGQAHEATAIERILKDVGDKTAESTRAAEVTERAMRDASTVVAKAATDAKDAITIADRESRRQLAETVISVKRDLTSEVSRIFAGENPELVARLQPVLDKFGADVDVKVQGTTRDLVARIAKQFDPSDPTSPIARHTEALAQQQATLAKELGANHIELANKVDELTQALKLQAVRTQLASVTPIKGGTFEEQIHRLMSGIATGLGDEYTPTGTIAGKLTRNKKGDGVLNAHCGTARVVLEMTDSKRTTWNDYLDEAERNRGAAASLGLVRTIDQNQGHAIRVIGARRIVMALDPDTDNPELLRTAVLLLRTAAIAATARTGATELATAEEKILEALTQLETLDAVRKTAGQIQTNATKIDAQCAKIDEGIQRHLKQALDALAGAAGTGTLIPDAA